MLLYFVRLFLITNWFLFSSFIALCVSLLRPFHPNNSYFFARLFAPVAKKILGLEFYIVNRKNFYLHTPCVFVSNHQHILDLLSACVVIPERTVSVGKKDLKFIPFWGQLYWFAGNILIDRFHHKKAMESMKEVHKALTQKNTNVWIMPEGTRTPTGPLRPFKRGAFLAALSAKVPIVPVCISRYEGAINFKKWKAGRISITALDPVETLPLSSDNAKELSEKVREQINQLYQANSI